MRASPWVSAVLAAYALLAGMFFILPELSVAWVSFNPARAWREYERASTTCVAEQPDRDPAAAGCDGWRANAYVRPAMSGYLKRRLAEDLARVDSTLAKAGLGDARVQRLMTITGINLTIAVGLVSAIGDVGRFSSSEKLVSYFGLNPRVRQSGDGRAYHGRISKQGRSLARGLLVEAAWAAGRRLGRSTPSSFASKPVVGSRSPRSRRPARSRSSFGTC